MKAEIISIGDELLIGQVVNTNSVYLSRQLTLLGIDVGWVTTIGDDYAAILQALETSVTRADVIIMTGGLGPTHDDVTKKIVCDFYKSKLVENPEVLENVRRIFTNLGRSLDERNAEQALVPENAVVLSNRVGTAPGLLFDSEDYRLFVLPGVPMEMKAIFSDHIQGILKRHNTGDTVENMTLKTTGIFESKLFDTVQDIVEDVEVYGSVAFLPSFTGVNIRLTVKGKNTAVCREQLKAAGSQFEKRLGHFVYATDDTSMPAIVQELLTKNQVTLAVADAYTGGKILQWLSVNNDMNFGYKGGVALNSAQPMLPKFLQRDNENFLKINSMTEQAELLARSIRDTFSTSYGLAICVEESADSQVDKVRYALVDDQKTWYDKYVLRKERTDNAKRAAQFGLNLIRTHLRDCI